VSSSSSRLPYWLPPCSPAERSRGEPRQRPRLCRTPDDRLRLDFDLDLDLRTLDPAIAGAVEGRITLPSCRDPTSAHVCERSSSARMSPPSLECSPPVTAASASRRNDPRRGADSCPKAPATSIATAQTRRTTVRRPPRTSLKTSQAAHPELTERHAVVGEGASAQASGRPKAFHRCLPPPRHPTGMRS
jgi:hypothetical protein